MMPVEEAIVETPRENGPCPLDDVVTSIPNSSYGWSMVNEVFRKETACRSMELNPIRSLMEKSG